MRRNTIVLFVTLFLLAGFAWAGWANWEYRQQAGERLLAAEARGELVADPAGGAAIYVRRSRARWRRPLRWKT